MPPMTRRMRYLLGIIIIGLAAELPAAAQPAPTAAPGAVVQLAAGGTSGGAGNLALDAVGEELQSKGVVLYATPRRDIPLVALDVQLSVSQSNELIANRTTITVTILARLTEPDRTVYMTHATQTASATALSRAYYYGNAQVSPAAVEQAIQKAARELAGSLAARLTIHVTPCAE